MPRQALPEASVGDLKSYDDYQRDRATVWPSIWSFRWWERKHHAALTKRGAVIYIGRRPFVVPVRMDKAVVELSRSA